MIRKQFTLYLENKPGALATLTRGLAAEKINIEGISAATSPDVGLVQIVVSNSTRARQVLKKMKTAFTTQDVLLLRLRNRPGELARLARRIAQAGVNINYIYATACDCGDDCRAYAVISAPDLGRIEKIWTEQD